MTSEIGEGFARMEGADDYKLQFKGKDEVNKAVFQCVCDLFADDSRNFLEFIKQDEKNKAPA